MEIKREDFPNSLKAAETSMAIPLHNKLTSEEQERVVESIRRITI
jgi:dTDP-4-amino-4,6-dideoxygalactose transaminase